MAKKFDTKNIKIANKFNKLLREVADYYNLEVNSALNESSQNEKKFIFDYVITLSSTSVSDVKYPLLKPFRKIWMSEITDGDKNFDESVLNEINEIIKRIRKIKYVRKKYNYGIKTKTRNNK